MDMRQLQQFLILCDTLNFRAASDRSHTSPSTLSRSIRRLEEEIGCSLFERDNRSVVLTRQGELLRGWAKSVLDGYKQVQFRLMEEKNVLSGELSIFGSVTAYYSLMSPIIEGFRTRYPQIHLQLHTGSPADAIDRVENNEVDLGITMLRESERSSIRFLPITSTPLVFIAPKGFSSKKRELDWETQPLIVASRGLGRERVDAWFRQKGILPNIYAQVEGNEAILAMVSLDCGIGVVPRLVLEKSPLKNELELLALSPELEPYIVGLIARKNRIRNPLVRAFWETVEQQKKNHNTEHFGNKIKSR